MWSKLGYVVFAADMFGVLPKDDPETRVQTNIHRNDRALMRARAQAGYDVFVKNPLANIAFQPRASRPTSLSAADSLAISPATLISNDQRRSTNAQ